MNGGGESFVRKAMAASLAELPSRLAGLRLSTLPTVGVAHPTVRCGAAMDRG